MAEGTEILGKFSDPALQARYKEQEQHRTAYKQQPKQKIKF